MTHRDPRSAAGCTRLRRDRAGQSTTIGVVLLLAISVLSLSAITMVGAGVLDETQEHSRLQRTEHTMTLFDSRGVMVALGESETQTIDFGGGPAGQYAVREDAGWLRITHHNYTAGKNETIYNASLGAVTYENGETTIAYQGGGVWRSGGDGSVMLSPPEFHYRDATLTLPVIRVAGDDGAAGHVRAVVTRGEAFVDVFPNRTAPVDGVPEVGPRYNDTEDPYLNPVRTGNVTTTVHSEYYRAWADYFEARTDGDVQVDHENQTVTLELGTYSTFGQFDMPNDGNSIDIRALKPGHSVDAFELTLQADDAGFNNAHWSFWSESGSQEFELHFALPNGIGDDSCSDPDPFAGKDLVVEMYYTSGTGEGHHEWTTTVPADTGDIRLQCVAGDPTLSADLTSDVEFTYEEVTTSHAGNSKWYHSFDGSMAATADFDQHPGNHGEPVTFVEGGSPDTTTSDHLVNHYMALMGPNFDLTVADGPGGSPRIDEPQSTGVLEYAGGGGQYVTYLHITENEVRVDFE